jgi:hypothetical protein
MKQYNKLADETNLQTQRLREKRGGFPCPSRCFHCCRNTAAMPISKVEGHDLKEGLKKLPQEVKTHILKKATRSIRKLEQLGHSDEEMAIPTGLEPTDALRGKREGEYPMLVGEVRFVYDRRPLICRVYSTLAKIALFSATVPWHPLSSHLAKSAVYGVIQLIMEMGWRIVTWPLSVSCGYSNPLIMPVTGGSARTLAKRLARSRKPPTATLLLTYSPKMIQTGPLRLRKSMLAFSRN